MSGKGQIWLVVGLLVVGAGLTVWGASIETPASAEPRAADERAMDRRAIAACRQIQNDELQELSTRREFRSACNKMEEDYKRRWGLTY